MNLLIVIVVTQICMLALGFAFGRGTACRAKHDWSFEHFGFNQYEVCKRCGDVR